MLIVSALGHSNLSYPSIATATVLWPGPLGVRYPARCSYEYSHNDTPEYEYCDSFVAPPRHGQYEAVQQS
eukprot:scaffold259099_cov35-Prasinocladus_malaysianus.AAC.1